MDPDRPLQPTRRAALRLAGVAGLSVPLLAACGSQSGDDSAGRGEAGTSGGGPGGLLTTADEVPVGSGTILAAEKVVLTQPEPGKFKAFSSICTHQACPVTQVVDDEIECTCHGSRFSVVDGSVVNGPATDPLPEIELRIQGEKIFTA